LIFKERAEKQVERPASRVEGREEIVGPPTGCDCFYDAVCKSGRNCVREITVERAFEAVERAVEDRK
jgi:hypothetical protein